MGIGDGQDEMNIEMKLARENFRSGGTMSKGEVCGGMLTLTRSHPRPRKYLPKRN